jgi:hypothetical protein
MRFQGIWWAGLIDVMAAALSPGNRLSRQSRKAGAVPAPKEAEIMDVFVLTLGALFFAVGLAYARLCDQL